MECFALDEVKWINAWEELLIKDGFF